MARVFISYCQEDRSAFERLRQQLAPLDAALVDWFADTRIAPGDPWEQRIDEALTNASIAVLLVTPAFLASEFIAKKEIPRLLEREVAGGLTIFPVYVRMSLVEDVDYAVPGTSTRKKLSAFQGFASPKRPLAAMPGTEQDQEWLRLARALIALARGEESAEATVTELTSTALPASRPPVTTATSPGGGLGQERELVIRLSVQGDQVEATYARPGGGLPRVVGRSPLAPLVEIGRLLDVARTDVLEREVARAHTGWGQALFATLLAGGPAVLRALHGAAPPAPPPNPASGAVRVWIATDAPLLRGLPWRLAAWEGRLLTDLDWTLAVSSTDTPQRQIQTRAPDTLLFIGSESPADVDTSRSIEAVLKSVWGNAQQPQVARSARRLRNALAGGLRPHIVIVHGRIEGDTGRAHLVLHSDGKPDPLALTDLARWLREGDGTAPACAALVLDVSWACDPALAVQPLLDVAPLVLWPRLHGARVDGTSWLESWLRRWLDRALDPVVAWHLAHGDRATDDSNAATVVLHASYRAWMTSPPPVAKTETSPRTVLDRRTPKAIIAADLRQLVSDRERRALAFVACAVRGHAVSCFAEQIEHYLQGDVGASTPLQRRALALPQSRQGLLAGLEAELRSRLQEDGDDKDEPLRQVLMRSAPKARGASKRVLWLDWGVCGDGHQEPLTTTALADWVRFGAEVLAPQTPPEVRLLLSIALELSSESACTRVVKLLEDTSLKPWYEHQAGAFRLSELNQLERVTKKEVLEYLATYSSCAISMRPDMAQLVYQAAEQGDFEKTVALLDEGRQSSWYTLAQRLRRERGDVEEDDGELLQ